MMTSPPDPEFATIREWCRLSGMGRTTTYTNLGLGNLQARRIGGRTLIDVRAGLAWMRSQAVVEIKRPPLSKREAWEEKQRQKSEAVQIRP